MREAMNGEGGGRKGKGKGSEVSFFSSALFIRLTVPWVVLVYCISYCICEG